MGPSSAESRCAAASRWLPWPSRRRHPPPPQAAWLPRRSGDADRGARRRCTSRPWCRWLCPDPRSSRRVPPERYGSSRALLLCPCSPSSEGVPVSSAGGNGESLCRRRAVSIAGSGPPALHEKSQYVGAQTEVVGILDERGPDTRARDVDVDDLGQARLGAARHERNAIGEQDGLVHIVRHHEDGVAPGGPHPDQLVLDEAAG